MRIARISGKDFFSALKLNHFILFILSSSFLYLITFPLQPLFTDNSSFLYKSFIVLLFIAISGVITFINVIICTSKIGMTFSVILYLLYFFSYGVSAVIFTLPFYIWYVSPLNFVNYLNKYCHHSYDGHSWKQPHGGQHSWKFPRHSLDPDLDEIIEYKILGILK